MTSIEFEKIIEAGLKELGLEWPYYDTLYELNINRQIQDPITLDERSIKSPLEYFKFLNDKVFPIVDELESRAKIEYWHILNHKALDIRLSISSDLQMKEVKSILSQHQIDGESIKKWGKYDDFNLGSRFGCQALLILYHSQSVFTRNIIRSIFWLKDNSADKDIEKLINNMANEVPIYTSHMLLNILPANILYEAISHLNEGIFRLKPIIKDNPNLVQAYDDLKRNFEKLRAAANF